MDSKLLGLAAYHDDVVLRKDTVYAQETDLMLSEASCTTAEAVLDETAPRVPQRRHSTTIEPTCVPMTPREQRLSRYKSIHSQMDSIYSSMGSDEWAKLRRLAQQGAVHYQAEEEFLNAPLMKRSQSAPTSGSLAERYERLRARACTSPVHFRRPESTTATTPAPAALSPAASCPPGAAPSSGAGSVSTWPGAADKPSFDLMAGCDSTLLNMTSLAPMVTARSSSPPKQPTRILVKAASNDEMDPVDLGLSPVGLVPLSAFNLEDEHDAAVAQSDIDVSALQAVPMDIPTEARARLSKKRGSDPDVYIPLPKKTKKKNRLKFFGRNRAGQDGGKGVSEGRSSSSTAASNSSRGSVAAPSVSGGVVLEEPDSIAFGSAVPQSPAAKGGSRPAPDASASMQALDSTNMDTSTGAPGRSWGQRVRSYVRNIFSKRR